MDALHPPISLTVNYGSMTHLPSMEYEYEGYVPPLVQGKSRSMPTPYTLSPSPLARMETTTASLDTTTEVTYPGLARVPE